jgi:hypothetical protein
VSFKNIKPFFFAFITFNPCFTAWVCHGVFTMCLLLLNDIAYVLSLLNLLSDRLLLYLIFLKLILKLLEYGFKEACDSNGVYMVLKKQRRWDRFEYRWAVGRQQATVGQEVLCRLYGVFWTVAVWGGQLVYFV